MQRSGETGSGNVCAAGVLRSDGACRCRTPPLLAGALCILMISLFATAFAQKSRRMDLAVGEYEDLERGGVSRAISLDTAVATAEKIEGGIRITGAAVGRTYVHVWSDVGRETVLAVIRPEGAQSAAEKRGADSEQHDLIGAYEVRAALTKSSLFSSTCDIETSASLRGWTFIGPEARLEGAARLSPTRGNVLPYAYLQYSRPHLTASLGDVQVRSSDLTVDLANAVGLGVSSDRHAWDASFFAGYPRHVGYARHSAERGRPAVAVLRFERPQENRRIDAYENATYGVTVAAVDGDGPGADGIALAADARMPVSDNLSLQGECALQAAGREAGSAAALLRLIYDGGWYSADVTAATAGDGYRRTFNSAGTSSGRWGTRLRLRLQPTDYLSFGYHQHHWPRYSLSRELGYIGDRRGHGTSAWLAFPDLPRIRLFDERNTSAELSGLGYGHRARGAEMTGRLDDGHYRLRYADNSFIAQDDARNSYDSFMLSYSKRAGRGLWAQFRNETRWYEERNAGLGTTNYASVGLQTRQAPKAGLTYTARLGCGLLHSDRDSSLGIDAGVRATLVEGDDTWDLDAIMTNFSGSTDIGLRLGYTRHTQVFGKREQRKPRGRGTVIGRVFMDANGDGQRQEDENGIENVTVCLPGTDEQTTDAEGRYELTDIPAGKQQLQVRIATVPEGLILTSPSPRDIEVRHGQSITEDFGLRGQATVSGVVYVDGNYDGTYSAEDLAVPRVGVKIGDKWLCETDASGRFVARNLPIQTYEVAVLADSLPAGYRLAGEPKRQLSPKPGRLTSVELRIEAVRSLTGIVFDDSNGNGSRDSGERGIANVAVDVVSERLDKPIALTDAAGRFTLRNAPGGWCHVRIREQSLPPDSTVTTNPIAEVKVPLEPCNIGPVYFGVKRNGGRGPAPADSGDISRLKITPVPAR